MERRESSGVSASASASGSSENDPRLRRYSQYKSERELYAAFAKQKSSGHLGSTSSSTTVASAAPAPAASTSYLTQTRTNSFGSSSYTSSTSAAPAKRTPPPAIPAPAVGAETKEVYTQVINFVTIRCPHADLQIFKDNCRRFGQDQMSLDAYFSYLCSICTKPLMMELMPQVVRLLPTQDKRDAIWRLYVREILFIR
jgi:hypothetical protein